VSATRKKPQRRTAATPAARPAGATQATTNAPPWEPTPLPEWRWMTVPVFFMFSLGGFLGLEIGIVAGSVGNSRAISAVSVLFALMFGLAFSRVTTRFLISRRWIKPRPRKR
jgi:hypothetical protein